MFCPFCNHEETKVTDSRLMADGQQVRRRRECLQCEERYTTYESAQLNMPTIIKRDGRREAFQEQNLRQGLLKALEKRPVSVEALESALDRIKHQLRACGEREINSKIIGEWVMEELRGLDQIAYVRFASVYRSFQDVSEFKEEVNKLNQEFSS